ncbi:MAG: DUF1730 domain-containing protein [Phycisphaeraceae bacterium]|nr:DUF1730 domain-containing protein [Phycisphaeraceae bacterium]
MSQGEANKTAWELVEGLAREAGFALVAVVEVPLPSEEVERHEAYFRGWLSAGKHGEMRYLAKHVEVRVDPGKLVPGARAVICVADRYVGGGLGSGVWGLGSGNQDSHNDPSDPAPQTPDPKPQTPSPRGRIARYAHGDDYHDVMKKRLFTLADALRERWPGETFRVAVDSAPVMERPLAARAGLGWVGKNTLLLNERLGSWLLLGEIVTTLRVEGTGSGVWGLGVGDPTTTDKSLTPPPSIDNQPPHPRPQTPDPPSHCGSCTRCIDACPTQCLSPYQIDASRCVSYLTIEHRSVIPPELHAAMGDWLAGCDVCQEVCPFNNPLRLPDTPGSPGSPGTPLPHPRYTPRAKLAEGLDVLEVLGWTIEDYRHHFRGSALKRVKFDMLRRNALIVAGNWLAKGENPALLRRVREMAGDEGLPGVVRETARQVFSRVAG